MKIKSITILCIVAFVFFLNSAFAKKVELKQAGQVAINFYVEHSLTPISAKSVSLTENFVITESSNVLCYIFNVNTTGYVIVSGNDKITPILGYSYEGNYSNQDQSPEFLYWMGIYKKEILQAITTQYTLSDDITAEWTRLAAETELFSPEKGIKSVTPLLLSTWDQGSCYNSLCPVDVDGPSGRCWAGCVATAMAQVMFYYRFPNTGYGSNSYMTTYGSLSANFAATTYDYNAMTNTCLSTTPEIGELIYHAGVSVNMNYTPNGSGADMGDAASALVSHFKYSNTIQHKSKSQYSNTNWENLLKADLNLGRPILYAGHDPVNGGHAWVCDGFQGTNYFHFNWGWSGTANGYYYLNALIPTGLGDDFTNDQEAIYNIIPTGTYPTFCSGTQNITTPTGTIVDGSGSSNYHDNGNCSWLVAPAGITHLAFDFVTLNTEATNDVVTIYDGPTTSSPVLGAFSGSTLPTTITSTSPSVLIKFTTNGSVTNTGWQIYYHSYYPVYCSGTTVLTAPADTISDGSGVNLYNNNSNCKWLIQPPGAGSVTVHFLDFSTEDTNDKLRVIDPVTSAVLATFSGTTIPSDITSFSGQMMLIFNTNSTITEQGWSAYYYSFLLDINDYNSVKQLLVYPNPAKDQFHISFNITDGSKASIEMTDITGQSVYSDVLSESSSYNKDIDLTSIAKGLYFLRISTPSDVINKKIVIE